MLYYWASEASGFLLKSRQFLLPKHWRVLLEFKRTEVEVHHPVWQRQSRWRQFNFLLWNRQVFYEIQWNISEKQWRPLVCVRVLNPYVFMAWYLVQLGNNFTLRSFLEDTSFESPMVTNCSAEVRNRYLQNGDTTVLTSCPEGRIQIRTHLCETNDNLLAWTTQGDSYATIEVKLSLRLTNHHAMKTYWGMEV